VPLIDFSIEKAPGNTVNWTDRDRISSVARLNGGGYLWIRRRYDSTPEGLREGRRETVLFFETNPKEARQIEPDCTSPEYDRIGGWLALGCAPEVAADQLLHSIRIFSTGSWAAIKTIRHCRNPRFVSTTELSCDSEAMDSSGS
jgi:hypothetical protein